MCVPRPHAVAPRLTNQSCVLPLGMNPEAVTCRCTATVPFGGAPPRASSKPSEDFLLDTEAVHGGLFQRLSGSQQGGWK